MTERQGAGVGARRVPARARGQRGAVTAETVMVLPLLVATTLGLAWLLTVAVAQVRVTDAAREVARALARDEPQASAVALGERVAPRGARIAVRREADTSGVEVAAPVRGPGGLFAFVPSLAVDAEAVAAAEGP